MAGFVVLVEEQLCAVLNEGSFQKKPNSLGKKVDWMTSKDLDSSEILVFSAWCYKLLLVLISIFSLPL